MKLFAGILLSAGSFLCTAHAHAQEPPKEYPAEPATEFPAEYASEHPAGFAKELPAEFAARANAATRSLRILSPEKIGLHWQYTEEDPLQRERHRVEMVRNARARESVLALPQDAAKRYLQKAVGAWRFRISNTSFGNWSPFPDSALDARVLSFPMPRGTKADKRTDQMKALDRMRREKR